MESPGCPPEGGLGALDGPGQPRRPGRPRDVADAVAKAVPVVVGHLATGELVAGGAGQELVLVVVEILERGGHDPALREETGPRKMEEAGQELTSGQITGGPEQGDHVGGDGRVVVAGRYRGGTGRSSGVLEGADRMAAGVVGRRRRAGTLQGSDVDIGRFHGLLRSSPPTGARRSLRALNRSGSRYGHFVSTRLPS